ncbi:MAG: HEAT repeat domain-containing protein [Thermodesulfobacteriota bacterium]|nr:HEAT repeat domain-containing protein [Thermodesulfobacteriota bacterium]
MEKTAGRGSDLLDNSPTSEEYQAIRDVIQLISLVLKNYSLYPENHSICQNSITKVKAHFDSFLKDFHVIKLNIHKKELIYKDKVVYDDSSEKEGLAFIFFRDGIQWLEIKEGLSQDEIKDLIKTLDHYKNLQSEAEGDLVTALWEFDFPHIHYHASDIYWETEPQTDLSLFRASDSEGNNTIQQEEAQDTPMVIFPESKKEDLWQLTPDESIKLRQMVRDQDNYNYRQDLLELLIILLNDQNIKLDFITVLDFLEDEFLHALKQGEFQFAFDLTNELYKTQKFYKSNKQWASVFIDKFFIKITAPEILNVLSRFWTTSEMLDQEQIEPLKQLLIRLPPRAILTLGPMLPEIQSPPIQRDVIEVIKVLARKDIRPLELLINQSVDFIAQKLVNILGQLEGEKHTKILLGMTNHSSNGVRKQALKHVLKRDANLLKQVFPLIEDDTREIRQVLLNYMGSHKSELAERLLLDYLKKKVGQNTDREHLLACYRTLGKCGSCVSVPFLKERLFSKAWIPSNIKSVHRNGAAIALNLLETKGSKDLLKKASKSLFPSVRIAYRKAKKTCS